MITTDCPTGKPINYMKNTGMVAVYEDGSAALLFEEIPMCPEDLGPEALALVIEVKRQMDAQQPPDGAQWV